MNRVIFFALVATAVFCVAAAAPQNPDKPKLKCKDGEAVYACGKKCEKKCNERLPDSCRGITCEDFACRCKKGLERNTVTGRCVPAKECPVKKCPKGEVLDICGTACEPTCTSPNRPDICDLLDCNPKAQEECRCDYNAGYMRNQKTGKCVTAKDC